MYLLIDIGGTKTLLSIANSAGELLHSVKFPTLADQNLYAKTLLQQIRTNFALSDIKAIGVAAPGIVENNKIKMLGNLPWKNFDIAKLLKDELGAPAYIENDANLAALAEAKRLPGRTVYLTFSTGIGGGVIDDDKLNAKYRNFEPGHEIYTYDSESAEWEDLAAAKVFKERFGKYVQDIDDKDLWKKEVPAKISLGLIPIIKELQPDRIIFGGPLGFLLDRYRKPLRKILQDAFPGKHLPRLIIAKYDQFSVIHGCLLYVKSQYTA
jgi:predicted NBD/HSP70 family sugar kinase